MVKAVHNKWFEAFLVNVMVKTNKQLKRERNPIKFFKFNKKKLFHRPAHNSEIQLFSLVIHSRLFTKCLSVLCHVLRKLYIAVQQNNSCYISIPYNCTLRKTSLGANIDSKLISIHSRIQFSIFMPHENACI